MDSIALYFHIPFCVRKCIYCAFYSVTWATEDDKDAYLNALITQMGSFPETRPVSSVYFGGGTPSLFGADRIERVLDKARGHFLVCDDCEITVEVNPASVRLEDLVKLRTSGVNRLSIGMQSSDDEILRFLGRRHSFEDVVACVENARQAGFQNISLDLLFGLPNQTTAQFEKTLEDALRLAPDHISAYSIQIEEGTPLYLKQQDLVFPTEEEEEQEYSTLCAGMAKAGFTHYEISSFAKDGRYSRQNMHYWDRGDYLGFGAAAHSFWHGKRFSNTSDLRKYIQSPVLSNDYSSAERISSDEAIEEEVMLGLRTNKGISLDLVSRQKVQRLSELGYLRVIDDRVVMTETGWRVSNAVIGQLLF